jgi:HlyD family secretion protein
MNLKGWMRAGIWFALAPVFFAACGEKLPSGFAGSGVLETTEVTVSAQTAGTVLKLTREEGDQVKNRELLATIDVEKLTLQKAQVAANLKEIEAARISAEATIAQASESAANTAARYRRIKELYAKGAAPKQNFDDVATQQKVAQSQLAAARAQMPLLDAKDAQVKAAAAVLDRNIADGKVYSPLDGVVLEKYLEPGEVVSPGSPMYKLADMNRFWMKIYVAEPDLGKIILGRPMEVRVDAMPDPIRATVTWTSPEAEFSPKNVQTRKARAELVYAVKLTLETGRPGLKIGMPAEAYFIQNGLPANTEPK